MKTPNSRLRVRLLLTGSARSTFLMQPTWRVIPLGLPCWISRNPFFYHVLLHNGPVAHNRRDVRMFRSMAIRAIGWPRWNGAVPMSQGEASAVRTAICIAGRHTRSLNCLVSLKTAEIPDKCQSTRRANPCRPLRCWNLKPSSVQKRKRMPTCLFLVRSVPLIAMDWVVHEAVEPQLGRR